MSELCEVVRPAQREPLTALAGRLADLHGEAHACWEIATTVRGLRFTRRRREIQRLSQEMFEETVSLAEEEGP